MYTPGTILVLKEPRSVAEDKEKKIKSKPFPYDRVKVIGQSPVGHSGYGGWNGVDAQGVILQPLTEFGGNIDEPYGKVMEMYSVESEPELVPLNMNPEQVNRGPSPEDQFKAAAGDVKKSETRVKTPHSPL